MNKDLTNVYKVDEQKGIVKYTVKANGRYFTGKSKCNFEDGDKFDLEQGKRIAKLRAIRKMKIAQLKAALHVQEQLQILLSAKNNIDERVQVYTQSICSLDEKLAKELGIELPEPEPIVP